MRKKLIMVSFMVVVAGCAFSPAQRRDSPAPIEQRGSSVEGPPEDSTAVELSAYQPPTQPDLVRPVPGKAVGVLTRRAADEASRGDYIAAAASLERALRIEPRNAVLWNRLARVRADQGQYAMAEELARKSNNLAAAFDNELRRSNWRLIADARKAQGDLRGAYEAERQGQQVND